MNLAISSLIIFLLVSPGIIARRLYYTKELSRNYTSRNTLQEIFSAVFLSFVLHVFWILIVEKCDSFPSVNFNYFIKVLLSPNTITDHTPISNYTWQIAQYFLSLGIFAAIGGYLFKSLVRIKQWDSKYQLFAYDNKWLYIFTGEVLNIGKYKKSSNGLKFKDVYNRYVDILIKSDNKIIYKGFVVDFQLSDNNSLDFIVLALPDKVTYIDTKDGDGNTLSTTVETQPINSNYFVVPYSDILNINIRYEKTPED